MKLLSNRPARFLWNLFSELTGDWFPVWMIRQIDLEPVAVCNLRCGFCQVPGWNRATETKPMTFEVFQKILERFPNLKHIKLQGMGEPFLNKKLPDMVAYASERRIETSITSNATLLTDEIIKQVLSAGLKTIIFSFDGASKATYEAARVGAKFEKACGNIASFSRFKKELGARTKIQMACLVSNPEILKEVPALVSLAKELGIEHLHIKGRLKEWKKLEQKGQYRFDSFYINEYDTHGSYMANARQLAGKMGLKFSAGDSESAGFSAEQPCPWPWSSLYVSTEGRIVPCCTIGNPDTWDMGNLNDKTLNDIWNSKEYRQLRKNIRSNQPGEICASCYK